MTTLKKMEKKRTSASKRAVVPRSSDYLKSFLKDWERLTRSGRYDMTRLKEAMMLLIYQVEGNFINVVRAGTHSELFAG